jgi:long-chain-fatty-acid--CoA ligase ACSBG
MDKVREIKRKLPHLKIVVQTREPFADTSEGFYRWEDLENMSVDDVEDEYQQRLADIHVNDCCSFIFTSGTTGRPKVIIKILFSLISHCNNYYYFLCYNM